MIRTTMQTGEPPAQMQAMMQGFAGGGGGRFGAGGGFQERPGETRPTPSFPTPGAGGRGGAGGDLMAGGMGGMQAAFGPLRDALGDDFAAIGLFPGGGGRGGRGGRGGQNVLMGTGDYRITLTVGTQKFQQLLRIERVSGGEGGGGFFGEDEEEGRDGR